jgi:hypothetical protein
MQNAGDAQLAAAVDSSHRYVVSKLEIDWNQDGLYAHALSNVTEVVESVSVERTVTGALPASVTLVEGFSAAQMNVQLGGKRPGDLATVATLLAPWKSSGVLFSKGKVNIPIRWWATLRGADGSVNLMRQFTGRITEFTVDSGARTVSLVCLDKRLDVDKRITLPLGGLNNEGQALVRTQDFRINSQWVIDYVLRQNAIYATPPPRSDTIYSATCHGSLIPELGFHTTLVPSGECTEDDVNWVPGRFPGMIAYAGTPRFRCVTNARATGSFRPTPGQSWTIQFDAIFPDTPSTLIPSTPGTEDTIVVVGSGRGLWVGNSMSVRITDRRVFVDFWVGTVRTVISGGPTALTSGTWQEVKVSVEFGSGTMNNSTIKFKIGSLTGTNVGVDLSALGTTPAIHTWAHVLVQCTWPISDLQINPGSDSTWYDLTTWTPQCYIDPGLNEFNVLPIREKVDSWELLKEVTGAEYGVMGFDESGVYSFRNRNSVRRQGLNLNKTLHADKSLKGLRVTERIESVANVIQIQTAEMWKDLSQYRTVYDVSGSADFAVPPGTTQIFVTLTEPCHMFDDIAQTNYTSANWDSINPTSGFCVVRSDTNVDATSVTVDAFQMPDGRTAFLNINNGLSVPVIFKTTTGNPSFRLSGLIFITDAAVVTEFRRQSSIDIYGERPFALPPSDWLQRPRFLEPLALSLLKDLKRPIPIIEQIPCVGDPRLQLLDTADLNDPAGMGEVYVIVDGISRQYSPQTGLEDSLTIRPYSAPGAWILGHQQLSILAQTTIPG